MDGLRIPNGTAWLYNSHETINGIPTLSIYVADEGARNDDISVGTELISVYMNGTETDPLEMTEMYLLNRMRARIY
jgi:hypothetical protein